MINKLYHISDIHIRLYERQKEYRQVFNNLYKYLSKIENKNQSLVVFTGDLFHDKNTLSPQNVTIAYQLLDKISNILPIVLIQGNHDANYNNFNRMDSITPIINSLNKNNIYYINDDGFLQYDNLTFYLYNDKNSYTQIIREDDKIKIGLYHGVVNNCVSDNGFKLTNDNVNINTFNGMDYVLLGDIHKHQKLQDNIIYSGSLIQQNFKQTIDNHGVLVWDLKTNNHRLDQIDNDYCFAQIYYNGDNDIINSLNIKSKPKIKLYYNDVQLNKVNDFVDLLKSKYQVQFIRVIDNNINNKFSLNVVNQNKDININNITNTKFTNQLIKQYLSQKYNDFESIQSQVYQLNNKLNIQCLQQQEQSNNSLIKILSLQWSNMFKYGQNNIIDFTKDKNKIIGLLGQNRSGKSSVIDILLYSLFDKCSRTSTATQVINVNQDKFESKLLFSINDIKYQIIRQGKKSKRGNVSVKVQFGYFDENNQYISLNGLQRSDTNKIIQQYLGFNYDTFCNIFMSLQQSLSNSIIKQKQTERKQFLNKIFKIDYIQNLFQKSKSILQQKQLNYKIFKSKLEQVDLQELNNKKIQDLKTIQIKNLQKEQLEQSIKKLQQIKDKLISSIKPVDKDVVNLNKDNLTKLIQDNSNKLIQNTSLKEQFIKSNNKQAIEQEIKNLQLKIKTFDFDQLFKLKNKKSKYVKQIQEKNNQIIKQQMSYQKIKQSNNILNQLKYDQNCDYCMNNPFVLKAIHNKNNILQIKQFLEDTKKEKLQLEQLLKEVEDKLFKQNQVNQTQSILNTKQKQLNDIQKKQLQFEKQIIILNSNIQTNKNLLQRLQKSIKNIQLNKKIQQKLSMLKTKQNQTLSSYNEIEYSIISLINNIKQYQKKINQYSNNKLKMIQLQKELKIISYYNQSVNKKGIPLLVIKQLLPLIQFKVNDMLASITNFSINFLIEEDKLQIIMNYQNQKVRTPVQLGSGFQKFISNLLIKIAISQLSSLNKTNFFVIDEGFGAMDSFNLGNLGDLFDLLKSKIEHTIIISHIFNVVNYVDNRYDISIKNNYSKIQKFF